MKTNLRILASYDAKFMEALNQKVFIDMIEYEASSSAHLLSKQTICRKDNFIKCIDGGVQSKFGIVHIHTVSEKKC